jgi:sterol desaturase/sphingolipid hydroxylase (fatty acid hydroxylase superfamily)
MFSLLVVQIKGIAVHSGYQFPWEFFGNFPGTIGAREHDYHHSHNLENYGLHFNFDRLFGTDRSYRKYLKTKTD